MWDMAKAERRARFKGHTGAVYAVAFSHDGKTALTGSADGTARLWDVATAEEIARLPHTGTVKAVAFSPDDRQALTGTQGPTASAQLARWAEHATGMRLEDSGTLRLLTSAAWKQSRE